MDKFGTTSTKSGGKVRKSKLGDMNFSANDLNLLNSLANLNNLNHLNNHLNNNHLNSSHVNGHLNSNHLANNQLNNHHHLNGHLNNSLNQSNGSLPPDLFGLGNLNTLTDSLNKFATSNATQFNQNTIHQLADQLNNKNAITSEFTSQSSMLYPNLPFYQQQQSSKLTLSSNIISPTTPFGFHPYLTAAIQHSLLNHNFLPNNLLPSPISPDQQLLMQQSLNSLNNLGSLNDLNVLNGSDGNLNSLNNLNTNLNGNLNANELNYLQKPEFNSLSSLDHLNQFNKSLNLLNETFLSNNLAYSSQHPNEFNFNLLNPVSTPSQIHNNKPCKRPKLEPTSNEIKIKKDFELDVKDEFLSDLKPVLKDAKEEVQAFKELKVQTMNDDKIEDDKKFSPDSSTELAAINGNKPQKHINLLSSINNQSPIITSTKSSSSEHSTSPDVQLNSFNTTDQSSKSSIDKCLIKEENDLEKLEEEETLNIDESSTNNHDLNNSLENDDENSLKIDLNEENDSNDEEDSNNESSSFKKSIEPEDLYSLISNKSFQPSNHFKEVSLDRMSFDEDEDDEDKSPINFNFKNLIDNDLNCTDVKDDETCLNKKNRSTKKRKDNDTISLNSNPWSIRRSERIFLNAEALNNSNNCFTFDIKNQNFKLTPKDLDEPQRVLVQNDDLLYCGLATKDELTGRICLSLDDVDCAKNNQIFTFDRLLQETIKEIKVKSIDQLREGCRVASFWSSKAKYLYPGRIGKLSDSLNTSSNKKDLVLVHFDDGDRTRISLNEIRLLPSDFELRQLDTDEENSSNNTPNEEKKVEKLKIKLNNTNGDQLIKRKKKKHSKERHHKHHHKKHRECNEEGEPSTDEEHVFSDDKPEENDDDWWSKVQTNHQWAWHGKSMCAKRIPKSKKSKKTFYSAIIRGNELIRLNDCAVFLSTGRPSLPFIGRIIKMWENSTGNMFVNVKWFYHPEETRKPHPKLVDTKVSDNFAIANDLVF